MTSVNSDDSPSSQSPPTQPSNGGSRSIFQSNDQSRSAKIQELSREIDALRAQQRGHRGHFARSRGLHFSGEGDEHHLSPDDRIHPGQFPNGDENEKEWKLEIKRWKRVQNRNGFSEIYDESEKIEDIRKREREMHSGGIPPWVLILFNENKVDRLRLRSFRLR